MKLWLISQSQNNRYDTYDSAVVFANSEREAQLTLPDKHATWDEVACDVYGVWAMAPEYVSVCYLGEAADGTAAGVICASFNAG